MSRRDLTFDPDVAVPLEVVVCSLPGVPVVPQKCDRRSRLDWYVSHPFLIWEEKIRVEQLIVIIIIIIIMTEDGQRICYIPTYSLGGDSRRSALPVMGLPGAFSSSVLLVSTISFSSVEITCCCLRGFFLGEAPGIRSPVAGVEAWVARAGADAKFALGSEGKKYLTCVYPPILTFISYF